MEGRLWWVAAAALVSLLGVTVEGGGARERIRDPSSTIALALEPNISDWQHLLLPCPTMVKLIGQMVVFSSKVDVSLDGQRPEGGWKSVSSPSSLRASVIQVGNEAWSAFEVAREQMSFMSQALDTVPTHVHTALRKLAWRSEPTHLVLNLVQPHLSAIEVAGELCVEAAEAATKGFLDLKLLVLELKVAVAAADVGWSVSEGDGRGIGVEGANEAATKEAQAQLDEARRWNETLQRQKALLQRRYEQLQQTSEDARTAYEGAIRKSPKGFGAFAMALLRVTESHILGQFTGSNVVRLVGTATGLTGTFNSSRKLYDQLILDKVRTVVQHLPDMRRHLREISRQSANNGSELGLANVRDFFLSAKAALEELVRLIGGFPDTALKARAQEAFQALAEVSGEAGRCLRQLGSQSPPSEERLDSADGALNALLAAGLGVGRRTASQWALATGSVTGRTELLVTLSRLEKAEERSEDSFNSMLDFDKRLSEAESRVQRLLRRPPSLREVRQLLKEVFHILEQFQHLWLRINKYFGLVASRAKVLNDIQLPSFLPNVSRQVLVSEEASLEFKDFVIRELEKQAVEVAAVCQLLNGMAKAYVRVLDAEVLRGLAAHARLITARNDQERDEWMERLSSEAAASRQRIRDLMAEERATYVGRLNAKRRLIRSALGFPGDHSADKLQTHPPAVYTDL